MARLFVSTKDESVRMFKSGFMEFFSKVHFTIPLFVYVPVVLYCLYQSASLNILSPSFQILSFLAGLLFWTFAEYFLHRFVFHYEPPGSLGKKIHFIIHGVHHDYPNDSKRLVMPPSVSIPLALVFFYLFKWVLPFSIVYVFFAGFIVGYLFYDMMHYAIHHAKSNNTYWMKLQEHHLRHHFKDPHLGYGVSSNLWDWIIGTSFKEKKKRGK